MQNNYCSLLTKEQLSYNLFYALQELLREDKLDEAPEVIVRLLTNSQKPLSRDVEELQVEPEAAKMSNLFKDAQIAQLKEEKASLAKDILEQVGQQRDECVLFKEQQWFVDICRRYDVDPKEL